MESVPLSNSIESTTFMMIGYLFAGLTGVFFGLQGAYGKVLARRIPPVSLAWGMFAFTTPFLLILLIVDGMPRVEWRGFLWAVGASGLCNLLAWSFFFRALRESALAHTMPFTAFTPVFLIPVAYLLLDELPDTQGVLGVLLIISGAYGIHMHSGRLLEPFQMLGRNRGTRWMLMVALIWSVSATVDKVGILASSQLFYGFALHLFLTLAYLPYVFRREADAAKTLRGNVRGLLLLGLITGLLTLFQFTALKTLLVSYVIAFKRTGVLVSVLFGAAVFGERHLLRNLFFTSLMIAGVFLLL